eukprot:437157-Prymnesium_polylepis.2
MQRTARLPATLALLLIHLTLQLLAQPEAPEPLQVRVAASLRRRTRVLLAQAGAAHRTLRLSSGAGRGVDLHVGDAALVAAGGRRSSHHRLCGARRTSG